MCQISLEVQWVATCYWLLTLTHSSAPPPPLSCSLALSCLPNLDWSLSSTCTVQLCHLLITCANSRTSKIHTFFSSILFLPSRSLKFHSPRGNKTKSSKVSKEEQKKNLKISGLWEKETRAKVGMSILHRPPNDWPLFVRQIAEYILFSFLFSVLVWTRSVFITFFRSLARSLSVAGSLAVFVCVESWLYSFHLRWPVSTASHHK